MTVPAALAIHPVRGERLLPPLRRQHWPANEGGVSLVLHLAVVTALALLVWQRRVHDLPGGAQVSLVLESTAPRTSDRNAPESLSQTLPSTTKIFTPQSQAASAGATAPASTQVARMPTSPPASLPVPAASQHLAAIRPVPSRHARVRAASPFGSLSAPMAMSLTAPSPPPPPSEGHLQRGLLLTMAPTAANQSILTRYAEARHALGEDWWEEFSDYVEAHKSYPLAAANRGEDGQSVLRLTIDRDGTVADVRVEITSGSPTLDMAWVSEFRGKKVPAFPPGTTEDKMTFSASMTYILEQLGN